MGEGEFYDKLYFENEVGNTLITDSVDAGCFSQTKLRIHLAGTPDALRYIDNVKVYCAQDFEVTYLAPG